ncbi:MAG: hypothetical protein IPJ38_19745 [Dechloromonas sp.]|uniref:Uncharacterized protein n=1 Tax=Candidatus Dechloromonas phosphorivorans TaxID=2899244 RepID=A0A935K622_9RHOO|nr:hypothetical protein [Candidatus Dechloromonas phosphorivorans]
MVGIPLGQPGYHLVEIESQLLGNALLATPADVCTRCGAGPNLAVHLESRQGKCLGLGNRAGHRQAGCRRRVRVSSAATAKRLWQGKTDSLGRAPVDKMLNAPTVKPAAISSLPAPASMAISVSPVPTGTEGHRTLALWR